MSRELLHSAVCENSGISVSFMTATTAAASWASTAWASLAPRSRSLGRAHSTESEGACRGIDWNDVEFQNTLMVHPPERAEIPTLAGGIRLTEAIRVGRELVELDHGLYRGPRAALGKRHEGIGRVYRKLLEQEDDPIEIKMAIMDSRDNFSNPNSFPSTIHCT